MSVVFRELRVEKERCVELSKDTKEKQPNTMSGDVARNKNKVGVSLGLFEAKKGYLLTPLNSSREIS
jgi:hypothetical protein